MFAATTAASPTRTTDGSRRGRGGRQSGIPPAPQPANLADILERVLDKGIVIAGDIQINLLDIELLTIKLRSADRLSGQGQGARNRLVGGDAALSGQARALQEENEI